MLAVLALCGCPQQESFIPPDLFYHFATYTVGKNPTSVAAADFNQDGLTDLITTNISGNSLSVLFGNGDGTFGDPLQIDVSKDPRALTLADFNKDGLLDLAVACSGSDQVAILFGLPRGQFRIGPRYAVHRTPVSIASGDVNGDGTADLAVALRNDKIAILLGDGDGTFREGALYEYGDTPTSVAMRDLNGDGLHDLVVTNGGPMSSAVSVWLGKGDGSFRNPTDYRTGKRPLVAGFADFNNDRRTDLLVINGEMDSFTTFLGNGDGTFQKGKDYGADSGPVFGLAGDFDGDSKADVAIANVQSNNVSILFGKGDGSFRFPPINYRTKTGPFAIATLHLRVGETEEPGLVMVNNGAGSLSIFLHRGLKSAAPPPASKP
jgi:hypothetical protein